MTFFMDYWWPDISYEKEKGKENILLLKNELHHQLVKNNAEDTPAKKKHFADFNVQIWTPKCQ